PNARPSVEQVYKSVTKLIPNRRKNAKTFFRILRSVTPDRIDGLAEDDLREIESESSDEDLSSSDDDDSEKSDKKRTNLKLNIPKISRQQSIAETIGEFITPRKKSKTKIITSPKTPKTPSLSEITDFTPTS